MKALYFLVAVAMLSFSLNSSAQNSKTIAFPHTELMEYVNTFTTMNELLANYQTLGLISSEEADDIGRFLKSERVDLNAALPKLEIGDDKAFIGKTGWSYSEASGYKTLRGEIVNVKGVKDRVQLYKKMYLALSEKSAVSKFSLLIPSANAASDSDKLHPSIGAGAFLLDHGTRFATDGGLILLGGFYRLIGGGMKMWVDLKTFFLDGGVECQGSKYVLRKGFSVKVKSYNEEVGPEKACKEYKTGDYFLGNSTKAVCEFQVRSELFMDKYLWSDKDRWYVNTASLEKILKSSPAPACNEKNARAVQTALRDEVDPLFKSLKAASGDGGRRLRQGIR